MSQPRTERHDSLRRTSGFVWALFLWLLPLGVTAHTVGEPTPFHLSPQDYFTIPVAGGTFSGVAGVQVRFTPIAGSVVTVAPEDVVANTSVGVRVPAALAEGQCDVNVLISGVASDAPDARIWVRNRPFRFIAKPPGYVANQPAGGNFKATDFADLDNDGFLDIFEANSTGDASDGNLDRLHTNQLGKLPAARACPAELCEETGTRYEQTVTGIPANNRTYDADLVDLDLDGDLDLVRIDRKSDSPIRVFLNDGSGHFVDRSITRSGIGPGLLPPLADIGAITQTTSEVSTGDADGDGRPDLLLCSWNAGGRPVLLLNRLNTSGNFVIANTACGGPGADAFCQIASTTNRGCAFGKFDTDNRLDIILPDMAAAGPDVVLLNSGNNASGIPQFTVRTDWVKAPDGVTAQSPAMGGNAKVVDLDGDGDDDVAIAGAFGDASRILWNDHGTKLVQLDATRFPSPFHSYNISFGDVDRDGDIDVFFAPYGGGLAQAMLINRGGKDGAMLFQPRPPADLWFRESAGGPVALTPTFELSANPGDYDLDGDLDLVTGGFSEVRVWKSDLFDQPGEDRDWVFVQDRTRSMVQPPTRDFLEPSKNVLKTFLAQRRAGDLAGLVTFDYMGTDPSNPNAADDATKAQVVSQVGAHTIAQLQTDADAITLGSCTGHCTAIGWAIKTGKEVAQMSPDPTREKVMVLLTDGEQNQGPHPDTIIPTIPSNIRLYTVALGSQTDDRLLSALATNGGKFYFAGRSSDYTSMQSSLREIDEDAEGHATGKQPLFPLTELVWSTALTGVFAKSPLIMPLLRRGEGRLVFAQIGDYFVVDPADSQVRFTLSWRGPNRENRMILVDPKGRTYPLAGDNRVRERRGDKSHVIEVLDPLSGTWRVGRQIASNSGPSKLTAIASSALRLTAEPTFPLFYVGEPLVIRAVLAQAGQVVPGIQAQAKIRSPSEVEQIVTGQRVNERTIEFRTPNLTEPGTYKVELVAFGPGQRPFVRNWQSAVHVAQPTPGEPDLRNAELTLSPAELVANGGTTATATLRLKRRDGAPLTGAKVSFLATKASMTGSVQDLGGGKYSQTLTAGKESGVGVLRARIDVTRLPNLVEFKLRPGHVDPKKSTFALLLGPLQLCSNQQGNFSIRVVPVDESGNPIVGATVEIEKTAGGELLWNGPTHAVGQGEAYERKFWGPDHAGRYQFTAKVDGTTLTKTLSLDVFLPDSAEGRMLGCVAIAGPKTGAGGHPWWLLWLLLLLLLLLLLWWFFHRRSTPAPA